MSGNLICDRKDPRILLPYLSMLFFRRQSIVADTALDRLQGMAIYQIARCNSPSLLCRIFNRLARPLTIQPDLRDLIPRAISWGQAAGFPSNNWATIAESR